MNQSLKLNEPDPKNTQKLADLRFETVPLYQGPRGENLIGYLVRAYVDRGTPSTLAKEKANALSQELNDICKASGISELLGNPGEAIFRPNQSGSQRSLCIELIDEFSVDRDAVATMTPDALAQAVGEKEKLAKERVSILNAALMVASNPSLLNAADQIREISNPDPKVDIRGTVRATNSLLR